MRYCLNYNKITEKMNCLRQVNEWTIDYNPKDNTLLLFLNKYKDKRINLYIKEIEDINFTFLEELCNQFPQLYIKFAFDKKILLNLKEKKIRFFFDLLIDN